MNGLIRIGAVLLLVVVCLVPAGAQLEWDRPRTDEPLPNPSRLIVSREEALAAAREVLACRSFRIKADACDDQSGVCSLATEEKIFARGLVADTQFAHFANYQSRRERTIVRGRVRLTVEVVPANPGSCMLGVSAVFEGLTQGATASAWVTAPSRGILEDEIIKLIVKRSKGVALTLDECPGEPAPADSVTVQPSTRS